MTLPLLQTPEYQAINQRHIEQTIGYLFEKNQDFAIACKTAQLTFSPELPPSISEAFEEVILFVISRYSLESAVLEEGYFSFEAGFGEENFGSVISMPLLTIKQIFLGDHPILINLSEPTPPKSVASNNSMEALLNNPENKKLLKKRPKP